MDERITHLTTFAEAVAARQPDLFDPAVKSAYQAGADFRDLLVAVQIARALAEVPAGVRGQAYESIHRWRRIAASRRDVAARVA